MFRRRCFFTAPDEYDGGELMVEDTYGVHSVKLPAGHMVLYPATSLHRVTPVTRGRARRVVLLDPEHDSQGWRSDDAVRPGHGHPAAGEGSSRKSGRCAVDGGLSQSAAAVGGDVRAGQSGPVKFRDGCSDLWSSERQMQVLRLSALIAQDDKLIGVRWLRMITGG